MFHGKWRRRVKVLDLTSYEYNKGRVVVTEWAVRCVDCALLDTDTTFSYTPRDPRPPGAF